MSGIVYDINNAFRGLAETLTLIECDYNPPPTQQQCINHGTGIVHLLIYLYNPMVPF